LMDEVRDLLKLILPVEETRRVSYEELFHEYLGINPFQLDHPHFLEVCTQHQVPLPQDLEVADSSPEEWLDFLMGMLIEPKLGQDHLLFVDDFPATQSSLAQTHPEDSQKTLRFEVYYQGKELGNGYTELRDAEEQKRRMENENQLRLETGKTVLPLDPHLQTAMEQGLPACAGIAMGFDRILMLAAGLDSLDQVQSFSWKRC